MLVACRDQSEQVPLHTGMLCQIDVRKNKKKRKGGGYNCAMQIQNHRRLSFFQKEVAIMASKGTTNNDAGRVLYMPMLKPVDLMSKVSGIGENKLRQLMENGEIEYVQNGNKRLLADCAIWDWYNRNKVAIVGRRE